MIIDGARPSQRCRRCSSPRARAASPRPGHEPDRDADDIRAGQHANCLVGTDPSCLPAFPADALPDSGASAGGILGLKSAASAVHAGYDRVVFTLGGSAQPGWRVEYDTVPDRTDRATRSRCREARRCG